MFNIFNIVKSLLFFIKDIIWFILKPVLFILILYFILISFWYLYFRVVKKIRPMPNNRGCFKEDGFFRKILYSFPKRFAYDRLTKDWDVFDPFGIHVFCGEQGSGKTMSLVYMIKKYQHIYPKLKVYTNFNYNDEDGVLDNWKDLLKYENGVYGIINAVDEIQTWFSNSESKDIPPAMIAEISQQRKQRKVTMGTAQVFTRIAKPFREQVYMFYFPRTYFGCLTVVRCAYGRDYIEKLDKFKRYCKTFFFIHSKDLRSSYDTYKKISRYIDKEFAESSFWGDPTSVSEPQLPQR